jgi:signal transduction histidine kinase
MLVVFFLVAVQFATYILLSTYQSRELQRKTEILTLFSDFESTIGYRGFIHNFKNAILRPEKPENFATVKEDYARTLTYLDRLTLIARDYLPDTPVSNLQQTRFALEQYATKLSIVAQRQGLDMTVDEIDTLIAVDDGPAKEELSQFRSALIQAVDERIEALRLFIVIAEIFVILLLVLFVTRELMRYEGKVQAEAQKLRAAQEQVAAESQSKQALFKSISHEMLTPIHVLSGYAEILLDESDSGRSLDAAQVRNWSNEILRAASLLRSDVENAIDFANWTDKIEPSDFELVDVGVAFHSVAQRFSDELSRKGVALDCKIPKDLEVYAQPDWLRSVFRHLLSNAAKFANSRIDVSAQKNALGYVEVIFIDDGPGFPENAEEKAFVPFDKLGLETSEKFGIGLGLPLVKAILDAMGAQIGLDNSVDGGAKVTVTLPGTHSGNSVRSGAARGRKFELSLCHPARVGNHSPDL